MKSYDILPTLVSIRSKVRRSEGMVCRIWKFLISSARLLICLQIHVNKILQHSEIVLEYSSNLKRS